MEICYVINTFTPGGAPYLLLDIIRNTPEDSDISYTVCVLESRDELVEEAEMEGARVVTFDESFKFDPRSLFRLLKFFRREQFDIIHTHLPYAQTLGRLLGSIGSCRTFVSTQHNVPDNYHPITRALERITRGIDDRTIAVSKGVEQAFTGISRPYEPGQNRQWCTIHNGINVASFVQSVRNADIASIKEQWDMDFNLIYLNVSRYVEAKSQIELIAAMDLVVQEIPDAHLFIVGWGELEQQLRNEVQRRELTDNVTITGKVPTVHEYYRLADVFVSSSTFEGLPIAHLEAMAAELPLVATDIPGVREVVSKGKNGILVSPGDPNALAEAMISFQSADKREQFGGDSFERVSKSFSIEQTVANHLSLYNELVER